VAAGIDPTRFAIIGYGQYRPVASNVSEADRNANRRVVLSVFSDKKTAAAALPLDDEMKAHSPPPVSP
jgi:chemotaxis protein MotB